MEGSFPVESVDPICARKPVLRLILSPGHSAAERPTTGPHIIASLFDYRRKVAGNCKERGKLLRTGASLRSIRSHEENTVRTGRFLCRGQCFCRPLRMRDRSLDRL